MSNYKVISPYVTLRVQDAATGSWMGLGFYAGATLPEAVNQEDLERHLRKGMVAEEGTTKADAVVIGGEPVDFSTSDAGTPQSQLLPADRPHGNASRDAWASFAASKGAPEEETRPVDEGGLSRDELRTRYAS